MQKARLLKVKSVGDERCTSGECFAAGARAGLGCAVLTATGVSGAGHRLAPSNSAVLSHTDLTGCNGNNLVSQDMKQAEYWSDNNAKYPGL